MAGQEYFTVVHSMVVNIEPLGKDTDFPTPDQFEAEIPHSFLVASEFSQLDHLNDRARLELKHSDLKYVIELLDSQNSKLNLVLTYMLSEQDNEAYRHRTMCFGASQLSYQSSNPLERETKTRVKLFLEHPAAAIYCYAQVSDCVEQGDDGYLITIEYEHLRDADQDLLIKAALYQQQKLLRQRTLNRSE